MRWPNYHWKLTIGKFNCQGLFMPKKLQTSKDRRASDWRDEDAIYRVRDELGLTQKQLAKKVGVEPVSVSRWEMGERHPEKWQWVQMLFMLPKSSPLASWIEARIAKTREALISELNLTNAADSVKSSGDILPARAEIELPEIRIKTPQDWEKFQPADGDGETTVFDRLPLFADAAAAGPAREVNEREIEGWAIVHHSLMVGHQPGNVVCIRVKGHSMEPVLTSGSIVGVDVSKRLAAWSGARMALVSVGGDVTVKLVTPLGHGRLRVSAYNTEAWPEREYAPGAADIRGLVAWWWARAR